MEKEKMDCRKRGLWQKEENVKEEKKRERRRESERKREKYLIVKWKGKRLKERGEMRER